VAPSRARKRRPLPTLVLAALLAGCGSPEPPPNVVLVTIDTLRADHVGCYGHARPTTPVLDGVAAEGTRFDRCFSNVPITLPSHCSMMTGLYPIRHGVRDNARYQHLDGSHETLAEILRDAGWATAAVVSAFPLDARFGIAQGFDHYDDDVEEAYLTRRTGDRPPEDEEARLLWERQRTAFQRPAATATERALAWLEDRPRDRPFFLWVHYFDPHDPYEAPPPYDRAFAPAGDGPFAEREAAYDGEIRYTDEQVGRLLAGLAADGELDRSLLLITADHGEGLGQHLVDGRPDLYHGQSLFTEGLRVPLLLRWPGRVAAGRVVADAVTHLDLLPTVLDLLGLAPRADGAGASRAPRVAAGAPDPGPASARDLFFETLLPAIRSGRPPLAAVQDERWKLVVRGEDQVALYDLANDPAETRSVAGVPAHRAVVESGRARLRGWREREAAGRELDNELALDEESLAKLRALGYVSDGDSAEGGS